MTKIIYNCANPVWNQELRVGLSVRIQPLATAMRNETHTHTSLQIDNHASTPPLRFLQAGCPSCRPTNNVKALKAMGNESVPKIITNTRNLFSWAAVSILVISNRNSSRVPFDKIASVYFICGNIYVLALEMVSPGNRHCASCIGTLSSPMHWHVFVVMTWCK